MLESVLAWIRVHWLIFALLYVILLAAIPVTWKFYRDSRATSRVQYGFLAQVSFVLNYLFIPLATFLALGVLLDVLAPVAADNIRVYAAGIDYNIPLITLIICFAGLIVLIRSLPDARSPDDRYLPVEAGHIIALIFGHIAFYGANAVLFFGFANVPTEVATRNFLLFIDTAVLMQFGYVHYLISELRRETFIHGVEKSELLK